MKKIIIAILFAPVFLYTQTTFQLKIAAFGGYENNLFNAPQFYEDNTQNEQFQSGAFQRTDLHFSLKHIQNNHEFKLTGKGNYTFFPTIQAGNLFDGKMEGKYALQATDKFSFFTKHSIQQRVRNNSVDDSEELRTPRSFIQRKHSFGTDYQLFKRNKISAELFSNARNYAETEESNLQFQEFGLGLKSMQKIKMKGRRTSYLTNNFKVFRRKYVEQNFEEWEEDFEEEWMEEWEEEFGENWEEEFEEEFGEAWGGNITSKERIWQFMTYQISYRFRLSKYTKLKLGMTWQNRQDLLQNRFGYIEIQPFFELVFAKDKWNLKWRTAFANRNFSDLIINANENELLKYQFIKTSLGISYEIFNNWFITSNLSFMKRWSNTLNTESRSYRGYFNGLAQLGLVYKF